MPAKKSPTDIKTALGEIIARESLGLKLLADRRKLSNDETIKLVNLTRSYREIAMVELKYRELKARLGMPEEDPFDEEMAGLSIEDLQEKARRSDAGKPK